MFCWLHITADRRSQCAGTHKKASGSFFVSSDTKPFNVTAHCHSPAQTVCSQAITIHNIHTPLFIFLSFIIRSYNF